MEIKVWEKGSEEGGKGRVWKFGSKMHGRHVTWVQGKEMWSGCGVEERGGFRL